MYRLQRIYKIHQVIISHRYPVPLQMLREKLEYDREHTGYYYALSDGQTLELPGLWCGGSGYRANRIAL